MVCDHSRLDVKLERLGSEKVLSHPVAKVDVAPELDWQWVLLLEVRAVYFDESSCGAHCESHQAFDDGVDWL